MKAKIGVFISGRGSNFKALASACQNGDVNAQVEYVFSDNSQAEGLDYAKESGIKTIVLDKREHLTKNATLEERAIYEEKIQKMISEFSVDYICLAGFMHFLGEDFVSKYAGKLINIHPSLLPSFPGTNAQQQAFVTETRIVGCTVHFVDSSLDGGKIIAQAALANTYDNLEALEAGILEAEHMTYAFALRKLTSESLEGMKKKAWERKILLS